MSDGDVTADGKGSELSAASEAAVPRNGVPRRDFLALSGLTIAGAALHSPPVMAGPFRPSDFQGGVMTDKRLRKEWVHSLFERGQPTVCQGTELDRIGMPVGGIGAGQLYLGGDGRLWHWDIFNIPHGTGDAGYAHPPTPASPLDQGFSLDIQIKGRTDTRALSRTGFSNVRFSGQYPIGTVEYRDPACPITATLEAFSPFIPLNADDSSLPATIMRFTLRNTGQERAALTLTGWLENAVCLQNRIAEGVRINRVVGGRGASFLNASAERTSSQPEALRPDRIFENWSKETYEGWTVEGTAFGSGPIRRSAAPDYQGDLGGEDERVVNSHATAPGASVGAKDGGTGKLTSAPFTVDRRFIHFWIGGGAHAGTTCVNLVVDGKTARSQTGRNDNHMALSTFDVRDLRGKEARLEIVDAESGPWGNIGVGRITFSDRGARVGKLEDLPDYGTMTLALLGARPDGAAAKWRRSAVASIPGRPAAVPAGERPGEPGAQLPGPEGKAAEAAVPIADRLTGALSRRLDLAAGQSKTVTFIATWHFPNLEIGGLGKVGRWYATKFPDAQAVAQYVTDHFDRLHTGTRLWRDTWYDSTLPYWFLDRTLLNISTLATSACYRLANGRFYAWEGVGCCAGTCTHVWHYAHAMARLFPELERDTRERVDFGIAFHPNTGIIGFRAEFDPGLAVDGQAGTLLRAYREHQMAPDTGFLTRCWPRIKKAYDPLFALDADGDGVMEGPQMNTLDQPWFGKVAWLSSLYAAALRAGEAMAREMGDTDFAQRCGAIAARGANTIDAQLFNGEYYQQVRDQTRPKTAGSYDGCEIDQVFGDSWARQVGLPEILPRANVRTALASLWKNNFLPDVGPFREAHKPGRVYAMAGEAGLVMCSWPKGESARVEQGFDFYFNECMTGFEYQAASHMIWEGMVTEGFAVTRAIHDRYHAARRNPWNEVECGHHYSRAMASYGVYMAACGLEVHSPKGHLGFAPRLASEEFKAAFTTAEAWGTFRQTVKSGKWQATITVVYGRLRLKTLALGSAAGDAVPKSVKVTVNGAATPVTVSTNAGRTLLTLEREVEIGPRQKVEVRAN